MTQTANTCALLTPGGTGAISVIRLQGPHAESILRNVFRPKGRDGWVRNRLSFGRFMDGPEVLDETLAGNAAAENGPAFDLALHGGIRIVERALEALERQGATLIESNVALSDVWPTKTQIEAEAIAALVKAKTHRAVRFLARQRIILPKYLEEVAHDCFENPQGTAESLRLLASRFATARILLEGATVVLVGPPNSGKSTLFNHWLGRPAAVVSNRPGTTRDWVSEPIEVDGVPLTLVDTAGHRETLDELEAEAIRRTGAVSERAEVVVLLFDGSRPLSSDERALLNTFQTRPGVLMVLNKADLPSAAPVHFPDDAQPQFIRISAQTGLGMDTLQQRLRQALGFEEWNDRSPAFFSQRQVAVGSDILAGLSDSPRVMAAAIRTRLISGTIEKSASAGLQSKVPARD